MKTYKGLFRPKYPEKYKGDAENIVYRSSWEFKVMNWLDQNPNIIEWQSEEISIPYKSPIDQRYHRYFPDFLVKAKMPDNTTKTMLLEVKPEHQTREPIKQTRKSKKYITEVATWGINQSKWYAAKEYCADRGWEFKIITEKHIFGKNK